MSTPRLRLIRHVQAAPAAHPLFWRRVRRLALRVSRALLFLPSRAIYNFSADWRRSYWEGRAPDVDAQWGRNADDFTALEEILRELNPARLLDFGCGSGRLFPLYLRLGIRQVVGQDISTRALSIGRERYPAESIHLTNAPPREITRGDAPFDVIICNRVLQHLPPDQLSGVLVDLPTLGNALYVNEMSETDACGNFFFMYRHDYRELLRPAGFTVAKSGMIGRQRWLLFTRN